MSSTEWPLMVFTLALQFSVGITLIYDLFVLYPIYRKKEKLPLRFQIVLLVALSLACIGVLFSLLHLGNPVNAFKTLSNLNHSWLSKEILGVIIYSGLLFVITFLQFKFPKTVRSYKWLLDITSIAGLVLIYVMSRIYWIPSVPAWNSIFTPLDFFLAILLSGSSFLLLFQVFGGPLASQKGLTILLIAIAAIQVILLPVRMTWLSTGNEAERLCLSVLLEQHLIAFYLRLGMEFLTIAFGFWALFSIRSDTLKRRNLFIPSLLAFLSATSALIIDRYLFYIQNIPTL